MKRITVVGAGYVGMANAQLLAQHNEVMIVDIDQNKIDQINIGINPIRDLKVEGFPDFNTLGITATSDTKVAYKNTEIIIIAVPTDFDEKQGSFDISIIDSILVEIYDMNNEAIILIKSTLPAGCLDTFIEKYKNENLCFSPEFLREGRSLLDVTHPERIVVGGNKDIIIELASLFQQGCMNNNVQIFTPTAHEAEFAKLSVNTKLALRITFFNEIARYCRIHNMDTRVVIDIICSDKRIGNWYNNPSFGAGGLCLPKDMAQMSKNYEGLIAPLMHTIVNSNNAQINLSAHDIIKERYNKVGIHLLEMKSGSDNHRTASIVEVLKILIEYKTPLIIYEPSINDTTFMEVPLVNDLDTFKEMSEVIVTNRVYKEIKDHHNIYTYDVYGNDGLFKKNV